MAFDCAWYFTSLPEDLVNVLENDISTFDETFESAVTLSGSNLKIRDSKTTWIPETHWISGLCYHYVLLANRTNFRYDITGIDKGLLQYTSYSEGEYYGWHQDSGVPSLATIGDDERENFITTNSERVRKLSFILQLSDPDEYTGGEVQLMRADNSSYFLPKTRGTFAVFDSRIMHRVKKVHSGTRKSLVGWIVGPRWK